MLYRDNNIDKISNKESMRRSHYGKSWDMDIYEQGRYNRKKVSNYIDRYLSVSIGENFDKVKKHMYEKMHRYNKDRYDKDLIESLIPNYIGEDRYCKYILDFYKELRYQKQE